MTTRKERFIAKRLSIVFLRSRFEIRNSQSEILMLKFHNTLSGKFEEFQPIRQGEVRFYYCGPTVWDYGHVGNFRSALAADVVRRYLEFKGYKVTHVMNITDVEDRIIAKSQEAGLSIDDYTEKYIEALWEDSDALGFKRPDIVPRATRHIPEMVGLIEKLLAKGHAYKSDGSIYYRISSFPEYGKLSKINFAGNIVGGSERIDTDKYEKKTRAISLCGKNLPTKRNRAGIRRWGAGDRAGISSAQQCR